MYGKNFEMRCALLLVILFAKSQQNFTSNNEKNDNSIMRYKLDANSTTNYGDETEKLTYHLYNISYKNNQDEDNNSQHELNTQSMQNEIDERIKSRTNSIEIDSKENLALQKIYENSMRLEDENDFMSHQFLQNSSEGNNKNDIVTYKMCSKIICIQLCCPLGDRLVDKKCIPGVNNYSLPNVYKYENKRVDELFKLVVYDPCKTQRYELPKDYNDFMIFANGSLYLYHYKIFVKSTSYCLAVINEDVVFVITICSETLDEILNITSPNSTRSIELNQINFINMSFHIVSLLFLLAIFLVYSILPELRNVHGFMLRNYSGALFIAYTIDIVNILFRTNAVQDSVCITIAFLIYFCFLASFFWLNVMSFDMWWTFREFCSLQRSMKQQQRRKLFYAIYAWGIPFILAIICNIMDFVPSVPKTFRPKFRIEGCWFGGEDMVAFILYYHGLKSMCVISSICLSISTALKIARCKKDISHRLKDSESKCYNDNKKWFNLYLKLFIVLFVVIGIKWIMITASSLSGNVSIYNSYAINSLDIMQNLCAFIIFLWKRKIKHMLLKRFGCGLFLEHRHGTNATSSSITTSERIVMQEKTSSSRQAENPIE